MNQNQQLFSESENQWKCVHLLGAIATVLVLVGIVTDIVVGNITGGNLSELPQSTIDRFHQFQTNKWLGLYNLDLLNIVVQLLFIPVYFALYAALRPVNNAMGMLAVIVFLTGSIIMVSSNVALPMLELSQKYFSADDSQRLLFAAAGEAMLARGTHGSGGAFFGFFIPNIAGLIISAVMLKGGVFTKTNAWLGIVGNSLMMLYVVMVTFVPGVENMATAFAMPGGLLLMVWMILFLIKLFKLSK
jgi:hypothetical protein